MEILALLALSFGIHYFDLPAKVEKVRDIWRFIGEFPEWLNYHKQLEEKGKTLKRKVETLCSLEDDINTEVESALRQPGKKRKREVENWLWDVQRKKNDVVSIEQRIGERRFFSFPLLDKRVEKYIQDIDELCERCNFSDGLLLDTHIKRREPFPTAMLEGHMSRTIIESIWQWLVSDEVSRIGIHGVEGVGKTAILTRIHNLILEHFPTFEHAYWVTVSQNTNIHDLQDTIAKEIGLYPLNEEDTRKRAAKLYNALKRSKKSVLVLDDISTPLKPENIGIPSDVNACKLIMTSRSLKACRMMDCQETIEVKPLSDEEAVNLFKEIVRLRKVLAPEMEKIAKLIVRECEGLPGFVLEAARRLKGVDDINEWMDALSEVSELKKGLID